MLTAYFDDSGTHNSAPFVLMGGLIGNQDQWSRLESDWVRLLERPFADLPSITRYHAYDLDQHIGEFSNWNRAAADATIFNFRKAIIDAGLYGYACAVDKLAWRRVFKATQKSPVLEAEHFCSLKAIGNAVACGHTFYNEAEISFVFDNRDSLNYKNKYAFDAIKAMSEQEPDSPMPSSISFNSSKTTIPLQAADLVAHEYYKFFVSGSSIAAARAHWKRLWETERFNAEVYGEEAFEQIGFAQQRSGFRLFGSN